MAPIFTAGLTIGIGVAYMLLATVRFNIATAAVLGLGRKVGVPDIGPGWAPMFVRRHWDTAFRWAIRLFFSGCAYTHFEIGAHSIIGDLPPDYYGWIHQTSMLMQGVGAWWVVGVLSAIDDATPNLPEPSGSE